VHWRIEPSPARGMRFSSAEISQILLALGALTLAFTIAQIGGISFVGGPGDAEYIGFVALASFVAVVTAFLLHELAHKAVALRYGCYAEFRAYPMGLLLGILTAAFGFLFAAPGAVMISGPVSPRQNARISAAGPGTNFAIAAAFLGLAALIGMTSGRVADFASRLIASVGFVNLFLGGFNMVPFPPLDGSKILAYNKPLWAGMVVVLVALAYLGWRLGLFF